MLEKSKKILIFSTAFRPFIGGSEVAIENISSRLSDLFFDVITPRYKNSLARVEVIGNMRIYRIGLGSSLDKYLFPLTGFMAGLFMIVQHRYLLVHAYQASYGAVAACLTSLFASLPLIITLQEGKDLARQSLFVRSLRKWLLKKATVITVISSTLQAYAHAVAPRVPSKIISNGVDMEQFGRSFSEDEKNSLWLKLNISRDAHIIMTTSRLVYKNGIDLLVEAFSKMETVPRILVIIGTGELKEKLQEHAHILHIEDRVRWVGEVPYTAVPAYLALAHVFTRPSRSEGLGNAFLEAMAAGVPVAAPLVGGIKDFLTDGVTGIVYHQDPVDIAKKLDRILIDTALRQRITDNARKLIVERFSWAVVAKKMQAVYTHLA